MVQYVSSKAFDYMNVLNKAAMSELGKRTVISNNIANADTPGYKRRDLDFESTLESELGKSKYVSLDDKVANIQYGPSECKDIYRQCLLFLPSGRQQC